MQGQYSQNVKTLLDSLMSVSAQKSFTATTPNALTRAYQCRGDLSNSECYNYINKIPNMLGHLCSDDDVVAAWVQLSKCYLRYEVVEFKVVPATQLLYKVCRARKVINGGGFKARRDVTFGMAENDYGGCIKSVAELALSCSQPLHKSIQHSAQSARLPA
ncbi:Cysteine-rich repeat secretory protein 56 [Glycine soja]|nr:Cysteine-rich repeat secretory protein 56 [Glycine max]